MLSQFNWGQRLLGGSVEVSTFLGRLISGGLPYWADSGRSDRTWLNCLDRSRWSCWALAYTFKVSRHVHSVWRAQHSCHWSITALKIVPSSIWHFLLFDKLIVVWYMGNRFCRAYLFHSLLKHLWSCPFMCFVGKSRTDGLISLRLCL